MNPIIGLILILRKQGWICSDIDWASMRREYNYTIEEFIPISLKYATTKVKAAEIAKGHILYDPRVDYGQ